MGSVRWPDALAALHTEVARTTTLLRTVRHPTAPALGEWDVAELAAHLSHAWMGLPALARRGTHGLPVPERSGSGMIARLDELAGLTVQAVAAEPERDLGALADRIDARAAAFFADCSDRTGDERCPWLLDNVSVDLTRIACHLLNETVTHAYDIARADGGRWRIDSASAAMVVMGFVVPVIRTVDPRTLVDQERAAGVRARYAIHLRGGHEFGLVLDDGRLSVTEPGGRVDCHVGADPATMLLMIWDRAGQWPAIATGRLVAWGRRPWLGLRLAGMLRNP
jgi:hypothetical protein